MFNNSLIKTTISTYSGSSFTGLVGFGYLVDTNTTYYALDWQGNKILIFNSNWQYLTYQSFDRPAFMITVNSNLYISSYNNVYKTDKYLNIISQYSNSTTAFDYSGLFFSSSTNLIYVAGQINQTIDIFDLNLTLVDSIATPTYQPFSLQGYKNYIYVGTVSGHLLVIENKVIIKIVTVCAGTYMYIISILIDHFGYMALSCNYNRKVVEEI